MQNNTQNESIDTLLNIPAETPGLADAPSVFGVFTYDTRNKACIKAAPDGETLVTEPVLQAVQNAATHNVDYIDTFEASDADDCNQDSWVGVFTTHEELNCEQPLPIEDILQHDRCVNATYHRDNVITVDWRAPYRIVGATFFLLLRDVENWHAATVHKPDHEDATGQVVLVHESSAD